MKLPQRVSSERRDDATLPGTSTLRRRALAAAAPGILAASFAAFSTVASGDPPSQDVGIRTLSTHADRVSGGEVLVQITLQHERRDHPVVITLNGRDISSTFRAGGAPDALIGLVTGLNLGKNTLRVQGNDSSDASLESRFLAVSMCPATTRQSGTPRSRSRCVTTR